MVKRIVIMAGGTGGHVFPALAVAQLLIEKGWQVSWLGTQKGLESRVIPECGIAIDYLSVAGIRGKSVLSKITAVFGLCKACFQAAIFLRQRKPNVVLGMGGFVAGPGGLMAKLLGIPLVIHEQNRVVGTTNRLLAHIANQVLEAFPLSFKKSTKAICTGNPLRKAFLEQLDEEKSLGQGIKILVIGGSQGAQFINEKIISILPQLTQKYQVIHVCGLAHYQKYQAIINQLKTINLGNYHLYDLLNEEQMFAAYALADLVLARSGAGAIFELAHLAKPSILIPLPDAAGDHQKINAYDYIQNGAGIVLEQPNLTEHILLQRISALLDGPERLALMAQAAKSFAKPDAAAKIAQVILQYAT
jgi:UDP-N-acetylglucosamine--N-acetylmuramyl-(pentapeptide) pyrophosphoryl-undecaprenol N-acetylglucosamine transferase